MAQCDLTIRLDGGRTTHRAGDTLRGHVEVRLDGAVRCDGLTLSLRWQTLGRGSRDRGPAQRLELFRGDWSGDEVHRHPFTLELPRGPFTYRGHLLDVVWRLEARAAIPWDLDPRIEEEIEVVPDPEAPPDWAALLAHPRRRSSPPNATVPEPAPSEGDPPDATPPAEPGPPSSTGRSSSAGRPSDRAAGGVFIALLGLPALLMVLLAGLQTWRLARDQLPWSEALPWLVAGGAGLVVTGLLGRRLLRQLLARRRLGPVTVEVEPPRVRAGEPLAVVFACTPRKRTEVRRVVAHLTAEEIVTRGRGDQRRTLRHPVYRADAELALERTLPAGEPFDARLALHLPDHPAPSFDAPHNALTWTVSLHLDIPRWPDWVEERGVVVHP